MRRKPESSMKAQMMIKFVVILIMSVVLVFAVISFASSLFRITDKAVQSYYELVQKLDEAKSDWDSHTLRINRGTAVVFFNKADSAVISGRSIKRPAACQGNCVCLCQDYEDQGYGQYTCESPKCRTLKLEVFGSCVRYEDKNLEFNTVSRTCSQGLVFGRDFIWNKNDPDFLPIYFRKSENRIEIRAINPLDKEFTENEIDQNSEPPPALS